MQLWGVARKAYGKGDLAQGGKKKSGGRLSRATFICMEGRREGCGV